MKKVLKIGLLLGLFCSIVFPGAGWAKVITLTLASQGTETSWGHISAVEPWAKQVEQATNGKLKIQIYAGQTLTKGIDTWDATRTGIADIGWCFHGYWPGLTPRADVISLPALPFKTAEKGSEVLWKLYEKFPSIQQEFEANKVLLLYTSSPYLLITRTKQVKTLEDIKGLKIRVTGGPPTDQMKALGGVPMLIPMPDNYVSLQRGVLDGMGAPWEAIHGYRLFEVVKYYTDAPFSAVYFSISMNKRKWDGLSKEMQEAIMSVSGLKGSKFWGKNWFDTAKDALMERAASNGKTIEVYNLPQAERDRWLAVSGKPLWDNWVKNMESKGQKDAQVILDATLEMMK